jgi:hypothetical protein
MTFTRLRSLPDPDHLPALDAAYLSADPARGLGPTEPAPRILLLYGSLRERSYSRFCVEEAARLLQQMGCETRIFDPTDLPLPGAPGDDDHPAVRELREHALWSEGMFQDKRAVHVGFTHAQHGVGQYAPWNSGIREPDARRWRLVRAEDMPLSPGIDNHERAMLYGTPERRGEKVECGAVGQN